MNSNGVPGRPYQLPQLPLLQFDACDGPPVLGPLLAGTLRVDCTSISLKGTLNGALREFTGPGYIAQGGSIGFSATVFAPGSLPPGGFLGTAGPAGTLQKLDFELDGTDEVDRKWHADFVTPPEPGGSASAGVHLERADCQELTMLGGTGALDPLSIEVWVCGELQIPPFLAPQTLSVMEAAADGRGRTTQVIATTYQSDGVAFDAFHFGGNTCIRARSRQPLPGYFGPRVWESMLFAFAGPVDWFAMVERGEGPLRFRLSSPKPPSQNSGCPPIFPYSYPPPQGAWRIFDCYLRYVLREPQPPEPKLHPLSSQVFSVRNSAGASVEAQSLALTVAVENLLSAFFDETGGPSDADTAALEDLTTHLDGWSPRDESQRRALKRVKGAIGNFKKAGAGDRLRALFLANAITRAGMDAWEKLRNAATHGDWSALRNDYQKWGDLIGAVRTLFHQLVFKIIGYEGTYTDYGTHGYPLLEYPPKPATGPSPSADGTA